MKTPEEIAEDVLSVLNFGHDDYEEGVPSVSGADIPIYVGDALKDGWFTGDDVVDWLARAIEADRAQRAAAFAGDLSQIIEFMAEDKSNDWSEEIATLTELEAAL